MGLPIKSNYDAVGLASLPRDEDNFIDERIIYNLLGKCKLPFDCLFEIAPYELVFYFEGYLEGERQLQEHLGYNLFSSIRQALSDKKEFKNIFEKQEQAVKEEHVTSYENQEKTLESLSEIFGI